MNEKYTLESSKLIMLPSFSWEYAQKITGIEFKILTNLNMFFGNGIRGGIIIVILRYEAENNN